MSLKLRDLILKVRECKTANDEREIIAKECAQIRTAFRTKDDTIRHRNVAKLLYIHMLGYPTHFGQMEAMKLVAAPRFAEKRIGYLALMLLLDETHDVLVLVTNSLKNDFGSANPHVAGLALTAMGNMCSTDIARDLSREVFKMFSHGNSYLRKKAALCAVRIIRKVPEVIEDVVELVPNLLSDKVHAVQLTGATLMLEILKLEPSYITMYRECIPRICALLKSMLVAGYIPEYDIGGVLDPFLQARLLELIRVLCTGNKEASVVAQEVLAQIAINTDATKSAGSAVLYECIQTIMTIEADPNLRVLAINALGRFLQSRDNNLRYVALNTLCKVVNRDTDAVQRHRNTVVDCLKDPDVSIRRRALDLIYALVTKNNVRALIRELLNYLVLTTADVEFKMDLTTKICTIVERFAPSRRWHIDTLIEVLFAAGEYSRDSVLVDLCSLVSRTSTLQAYAVHRITAAYDRARERAKLREDTGIFPHTLGAVACWIIGEYGINLCTSEASKRALKEYHDTLRAEAELELQPQQEDGTVVDPLANADQRVGQIQSPIQVLVLLETALRAPPPPVTTAGFSTASSQAIASHSNSTTYEVVRQSALTAIAKLSVRFSQSGHLTGEVLTYIKTLLSTYSTAYSAELQQRSSEYTQLVNGDTKLRDHILAPVPQLAPSKKTIAALSTPTSDQDNEDDDEDDDEEEEDEETTTAPTAASTPAPAPSASTIDIFGLLGDMSAPAASTSVSTSTPSTTTTAATTTTAMPTSDPLLADIFGSMPSTTSTPSTSAVDLMAGLGLSDMAGMSSTTNANASTVSSTPSSGGVFDIFGGDAFSSTPTSIMSVPQTPTVVTFPSETVYDQDGLRVVFDFTRKPDTPHILNVLAHYYNSTPTDFVDFEMQLAVPGHLKRELKPASSTIVRGNGGEVTQSLILTNEMYGTKKTLVKTRLIYKVNGTPVTKEVAISKFPA